MAIPDFLVCWETFPGGRTPKYDDEWCFSTRYPEKNHSYLTVRGSLEENRFKSADG